MLNNITTYSSKGITVVSPWKIPKPADIKFPYIKISTIPTKDLENIDIIKGQYVLNKKSKIRSTIRGSHLLDLVKKIRGEGITLNQKINYCIKNYMSKVDKETKNKFISDLSCYLVYLKLMKDPEIWNSGTFPFPFKLPVPDVGSDCMNYKIYVQVQCLAQVTIVAGENLPGTHWMKQIADFWPKWGNCFETDGNDYTLLEAQCETIINMTQYIKNYVDHTSQMSASSAVEYNAPLRSSGPSSKKNMADSSTIDRTVKDRITKLDNKLKELEIENDDLRKELQDIKLTLNTIIKSNTISL